MKEVKAGNYAGAWDKVNELKDVVDDKQFSQNLILIVVNTEARAHSSKKEWESAVTVYAEALKKMPGDGHCAILLLTGYPIAEPGRS